MTPYPFAVGDVVAGADCLGRPFEARVVAQRGPYSVVLDDGYVTPVSLLRAPSRSLEDALA